MQKTSKNMQKQQKSHQVLKLRQKGYGYKSIANILNINRDEARNECKKNNLIGYGQQVRDAVIEPINIQRECLYCGKEINTQERRGRKSKYCTEKCRRAWWSENNDKKNKMAWYTFTCKHCDKEFKAYGNKNRKFCSIRCSIDYRFGTTIHNE